MRAPCLGGHCLKMIKCLTIQKWNLAGDLIYSEESLSALLYLHQVVVYLVGSVILLISFSF
jgi:hypothetical protein